MEAVSRWFLIDDDGQPVLPGWYEISYWPGDDNNDRIYWDGTCWRHGPMDGRTEFGNYGTSGESWRGLSDPPQGVA